MKRTPVIFWVVGSLVAFHPRPQIASDLGRNVTRNFNPHPKSQPIFEWERNFGLWPQTQIAAGLNPLRFENRKPNPPLFTSDLNSSNRKPAGRNRRIRAARRPQIAESPATRPLRSVCLESVPGTVWGRIPGGPRPFSKPLLGHK